MNKKGDLLNNVLTTVIAVIGLALIAYAAYKLYMVSVNQENINAQHLVDSIASKIDNLPVLGYLSPSGLRNASADLVFSGFKGGDNWILVTFNKEEKIHPDKCYFKNCICVCKTTIDNGEREDYALSRSKMADYNVDYSASEFDVRRKIASACQTNGFCRLYDISFYVVSKKPEPGRLSYDWPLAVGKNLFELGIAKESNTIWIYYPKACISGVPDAKFENQRLLGCEPE